MSAIVFKGDDYQAYLYSFSDQTLSECGFAGWQDQCGMRDQRCRTNRSAPAKTRTGISSAFIWSRNQPIASLGTLDGASTSEAFGINNSGAVVGDSQSGSQNHRPVIFPKTRLKILGLATQNSPDALETAYAINDAGQDRGRDSAGNNAFHAFVDVNGNTTDLTTLGGTNGEAFAVNKNGLVVGDSDTAEGPLTHSFLIIHK